MTGSAESTETNSSDNFLRFKELFVVLHSWPVELFDGMKHTVNSILLYCKLINSNTKLECSELCAWLVFSGAVGIFHLSPLG